MDRCLLRQKGHVVSSVSQEEPFLSMFVVVSKGDRSPSNLGYSGGSRLLGSCSRLYHLAFSSLYQVQHSQHPPVVEQVLFSIRGVLTVKGAFPSTNY